MGSRGTAAGGEEEVVAEQKARDMDDEQASRAVRGRWRVRRLPRRNSHGRFVGSWNALIDRFGCAVMARVMMVVYWRIRYHKRCPWLSRCCATVSGFGLAYLAKAALSIFHMR